MTCSYSYNGSKQNQFYVNGVIQENSTSNTWFLTNLKSGNSGNYTCQVLVITGQSLISNVVEFTIGKLLIRR